MGRKAIGFILVSLVLPAGALPADDVQPTAAEEILFQELPSVFGASRYEQKTSEAPAWVTLVTAEEIATHGYRTLGEILRSVPGFYATYDRNYTYIGVRGYLRPGDYNSRVLLLIDGHRTNDNVYDSTFFGNEALVGVEMIERVEVIRGPASSLYGTNAFFAVINIVTRVGSGLKGTEVAGNAGSYGTYGGYAAWGGHPPGGPESIVSASYLTSDGQNLFFPEFDSPATNNGLAEDADGEEASGAFGKIRAGDFTLSGAYKTRDKNLPTASFGTEFNDPRTETRDTRYYARMAYETEVAPKARLAASLAYDYYRYDGAYAYTTGLFRDYGHGRWWTADVHLNTTVGSRQKLIVGAEYRDNFKQDQGAYDPTAVFLRDERSSAIWALYAQDEIRASERVLLNIGLRHDDYETFGGSTNPRLAVIITPAPSATLKLTYGRAFRAPNTYELFYDDSTTQKGNPDLEPEEIDTFEIAWEQGYRGGLRSVVAAYHYKVDQLISQNLDLNDGLLVFTNVDEVTAHGVDLSLEGPFGPYLSGRVWYSYQHSEDDATGEALTNSPRHMAGLGLDAPLAGERLRLALEAQYLSDRGTVQGGRADQYVVTNLVLTSRGWAKGLFLTGGLYNITDTDYANPVGQEFVQDTITQDGRNFRIEIKYRF